MHCDLRLLVVSGVHEFPALRAHLPPERGLASKIHRSGSPTSCCTAHDLVQGFRFRSGVRLIVPADLRGSLADGLAGRLQRVFVIEDRHGQPVAGGGVDEVVCGSHSGNAAAASISQSRSSSGIGSHIATLASMIRSPCLKCSPSPQLSAPEARSLAAPAGITACITLHRVLSKARPGAVGLRRPHRSLVTQIRQSASAGRRRHPLPGLARRRPAQDVPPHRPAGGHPAPGLPSQSINRT